jgi:GNAT superfamily N-acetyltransferase
MHASAQLTTLDAIGPWRDLYREEMNCQILHDSIHVRPGWSLEYELLLDGVRVGYGSVAIAGPWKDKPTLYEFFVVPKFRTRTFALFEALLRASNPVAIETQSNDPFLTNMLFVYAREVESECIIFHDRTTTSLAPAGATFRKATAADKLDVSASQLDSHGVIEFDGAVVASGGILYHYNRPYGDIYMDVVEAFRRRGFGSFLVQELKRVCYDLGSIPSARCNVTNFASRHTLQKAGFVPCGNGIVGKLPR